MTIRLKYLLAPFAAAGLAAAYFAGASTGNSIYVRQLADEIYENIVSDVVDLHSCARGGHCGEAVKRRLVKDSQQSLEAYESVLGFAGKGAAHRLMFAEEELFAGLLGDGGDAVPEAGELLRRYRAAAKNCGGGELLDIIDGDLFEVAEDPR